MAEIFNNISINGKIGPVNNPEPDNTELEIDDPAWDGEALEPFQPDPDLLREIAEDKKYHD